jgi:outer membrane protein OmpU
MEESTMNKLLLGTALVALSVASAPAFAQDNASGVKLNVGGYFKGYGNYTNQDDNLATGDVREFDIIRDTEVHFGGETTLDNGLTVGAQIEAKAQSGEDFTVDESYAYFSGTWGRVNFGEEDGAAYLLQVAAPSADDNIDGIRSFINPVNTDLATLTSLNTQVTNLFNVIDYDNDFARGSDKITYLTPVFSGFQAGASYTPEATDESRRTSGNSLDNQADSFGDVWEIAGRYEGQFNNVGVIAGAGYTQASLENEATSTIFEDDFKEWNVGLDLDIGAFGLGAIYTTNNLGLDDVDSDTYVVGADYTTGPFKIGASYLNNDIEDALETDRYTGGVTYTYGPGMSFRGSVAYIDHQVDGGDDGDATSVLLGTQINF